ncbi:hypothetical protein SAMN06295967_11262 [Belliella buryatensis]|uniref:IPT/TIG domain-containing protein n=1 Tax=Belliella buryatensis TaxID=1500549 RepID=A0A239FDX4_9BACT|nr:hypothetical protein [Belliella buryatensis]SNS54951.1 hypothetical protein SAMN06295967_11262 [Belliella buryatensis]
MKKTIIYLFVASITLFSCQKEMDFPFTDPNFSPPLLGSINENGAEFTCEVYETGNLPILEYGFMYSTLAVPRPLNSEIISTSGKPDKKFSRQANYALRQGERYYVVSFVRNEKGYVFSEAIPFDSKGSLGFQITDVIIPEPLYFGDTIHFNGNGFSRIFDKYRIKLDDSIDLFPLEVSENGFKAIFPKSYLQLQSAFTMNQLNFKIKIDDKELQVSKTFTFRDPLINNVNPQTYNFNDEIIITGKYLLSDFIYLYTYENEEQIYYSVNYKSEDTIKISAPSRLPNPNPTVNFFIRNKTYLAENLFKLNPSELNPNQNFKILSTQYFTLEGFNFNEKWENSIWIDKKIDASNYFSIRYIDDQKLEMYSYNNYYQNKAPILNRTFELSVKSLGAFSQNSANLTLLNPTLPFLNLPEYLLKTDINDKRRIKYLQFEDKVLALSKNLLYQFYPFDKSFKKLTFNHSTPQNIDLGNLFTKKTDDGRAIIGSADFNMSQNTFRFDLFDPKDNSLSTLQDFPNLIKYINGVAFSNGKLRLSITTQKDQKLFNESWVLDLEKNEWSKISDLDSQNFYIGFKYNSQSYAFHGNEYGRLSLKKLNESTEEWGPEIEYFGNIGIPKSSEVLIIDQKAYVYTSMMYLLIFDMQKMQLEKIVHRSIGIPIYTSFDYNYTFAIDSKVYYNLDDRILMELDLEYL